MKYVFITILIYLILVSCNNYFESKIVEKNFNNFERCYIYLDIKNQDSIYTIIGLANSLYYDFNHYNYFDNLSKNKYKRLIKKSLISDGYIKVNNIFYNHIKNAVLDQDLIKKYDTIDILKSDLIINGNLFSNSLNREEQNAIIYILLKKDLKNCCQNCETGIDILIDSKYPISD